jgi:predicted nucleotidyltransferase
MGEQVKTDLTADAILRFLEDHRETLRAMGVKRIGLFGSYARNEQSESSDVEDLLFAMDTFTWARWMDVWNYIEDGLSTTIDLVPEKDLREEIRSQVLSEVRYVE